MSKPYVSIFNERQYMNSNYFELYYYEDTSFSGVKNHTHDYYEFYFIVNGDMSMFINQKKYTMKKGDVIVIPPGIPH
ncbi:MAG: cupin domain-containing protein, partial [Erysipelotrichaceae bacterium]|nr:cupin domain-containing protein [Erysipelotrichaceae bacterium]